MPPSMRKRRKLRSWRQLPQRTMVVSAPIQKNEGSGCAAHVLGIRPNVPWFPSSCSEKIYIYCVTNRELNHPVQQLSNQDNTKLLKSFLRTIYNNGEATVARPGILHCCCFPCCLKWSFFFKKQGSSENTREECTVSPMSTSLPIWHRVAPGINAINRGEFGKPAGTLWLTCQGSFRTLMCPICT